MRLDGRKMRLSSSPAHAARRLLIAPLVFYQRAVSPALPRRCRYEPTCSRYAVQAVEEYGILRGLVLAGWRLLRCNPFSHGGYDPVQAQRLFRASSHPSSSPAGTDSEARSVR
jgi:putative membrane protein insertion efficiency factor